MTLDMRTVLLFSFVNYFVGVLCMSILWNQNHRQFKGIGLWILDMVFQILAVVLLLLRGAIPDVLSIALANTLVCAGMVSIQFGMERFLECRWPRWQNWLLISIVFGLFYYFGNVAPDLATRNLIASSFAVLTSTQTAWILFIRSGKAHPRASRLTGATFLGYATVSLFRILVVLLDPRGTIDFFQSPFLEVLPIALLVALTTLLTVSLVLLVNVRLVEARVAEEEKFSLAFQSAPYAIIIADASDGRIQDVNEGFMNMMGFTEEEAIGRTTVELGLWTSGNDRDRYVGQLREANRIDAVPYTTHSKNGTSVEVLLSARLFTAGRRDFVISVLEDVTERLENARRLEESEAKYRSVWDNSLVGQSLTRTTGEVEVNRAFADMLGYTQAELAAARWQDITHPDDIAESARYLAELQAGPRNSVRFTKRFLRKDGSIVWADLMSLVRRDAEGRARYFMTSVLDITDQKRAEQERSKAEGRLRQQQKLEAIGTLAAGVAHEINNPLTGILNYAQLVLDEAVPASAEATYLQGIIDESQRVSKIVSNLLQFSRQDKQSHSYARIGDVIDRTVSLVRTIIKKDRIDLQVDLPEDLPDVKCRSQQLQQVVMNLLTNARDALNEKYPGADPDKIIRISCRAFEQEDRRWIRISVEDHGVGITPEVRQKIFEPFFSTKSKDKGTGLGLSISHGIVADHHGYIEIDSEPGQPTCVSVVLPVDNGWDHLEGE